MSTITQAFDLTGKHAFITGSSRGLGLAIARGLAEAGARVTLNGRSAQPLQDAVDSLKSEQLEASYIVADVTKAADISDALGRVEPVDILVNNAGIQLRAPFVDQTDETWRIMFETHVMGAVLPCRAVLPGMIARGGGKIINICSLMSEKGRANIVPYSAMKGAMKMLTRGLATELGGRNIQVNGIGPGYFLTDMNAALIADPAFDAMVKGKTPAGRWGRPEELVGTAVFLASSASDFVNGQIIYVDGGIMAAL